LKKSLAKLPKHISMYFIDKVAEKTKHNIMQQK